jgi:hypothetical protein
MLLNCGACEHVRQMLELPDTVRVIVIDAHRPIHHSYNNEADTSTLFLHDPADGTAAEDVPLASDSESSGSGDDALDDFGRLSHGQRHVVHQHVSEWTTEQGADAPLLLRHCR